MDTVAAAATRDAPLAHVGSARPASPPRPPDVQAALEARPGFRRHAADVTWTAARVRGAMPVWLAGDLMRTAPGQFRADGWQAEHWFDGLCLLYSFRVGAGRVDFAQRMLRSVVHDEALVGRTPRASFASPIRRSFWKRLFQPLPLITDNTNVNLVKIGDARVALTESRHQWRIDPDTLEAMAPMVYTDDAGTLDMLAHPQFDYARRRLVNLGFQLGPSSSIVLFEQDERARRPFARINVKRVPYIHAFGLSADHAIVVGQPFRANPLKMLWSNRGFIDHFEWSPNSGTTVWRVDRKTGQVSEHQAPPFFFFHVANTWDEGDATHIDLLAYDDPSVVARLSVAELASGGVPALAPRLVRLTTRPGKREAELTTLVERGFEFPVIHERLEAARAHSVVWGTRYEPDGSARLVRQAVGGETIERGYDDLAFGEPVLVSAPDAKRAGDGVLLTVGASLKETRSRLLFIDPHTLDEIASAEIPFPLPLGFHGNFFRR